MEAMFDRMDAIGKNVLGADDPMLPVPQPQVRSACAGRILPDVRLLERHRRADRRGLPARRASPAGPSCWARSPAIERELQAGTPDWPARMAAWEGNDPRRSAACGPWCGRSSTPAAGRSIICWPTDRCWPRAMRRPSTPPSSSSDTELERASRPCGSNCSTIRRCPAAGRAARSRGPFGLTGIQRRGGARRRLGRFRGGENRLRHGRRQSAGNAAGSHLRRQAPIASA